MLFGNVIKFDRGTFLPNSEQTISERPLSSRRSDMLQIHDNPLKASAKESLRTDLLHVTSKEHNSHKEYPTDSYVLVHYRTG